MVPEWRQHRDEVAASVRQRKDTELVQDVLSVGDGGVQPVEIVLLRAAKRSGDDSKSELRYEP